MGSIGAKQTTTSGERVRDDYGREYAVVTKENIPAGYSLWASGTWRGANDDYNNGYAVFANINPTTRHVDTQNAVVVRISGEDASTIKSVAAVDERDPVGAAERYAKKYANSKYGATRRRAEQYSKLVPVLKRLGL